ncbi:hypothetical protein B0H13DRAFT_1860415 [Mycena leptocephala]|nr:hypothetical protein B0H13DRAFT_1860415 [Mycena leptocephala]
MSFTRLAASSRPVARRLAATRAYATAPPPPPPEAKTGGGGSRTTAFLILTVLAGGAGYYYYTNNPERVDALAHKAKAEEELAVRHAKEMGNNAMVCSLFLSIKKKKRTTAETMIRPQAKTASPPRAAPRLRRTGKLRRRQGLRPKRPSSARSSTENLYQDARAKGDQTKHEAKATWSSWLGWGSAKADEGKEKLEEGKEKAAKEGAKAAGDAQKKLEKHT